MVKVWVLLWRKPYSDGSGFEGEPSYHSVHESLERAYEEIGRELVERMDTNKFIIEEDELKEA